MNEGGFLRGVQEQLPVDRQGRSYSQPLARAAVDFVGDGVQLFLAVVRLIGTFGQVLPNQAVGVLIADTLPWAVRIAKVHGNAGVYGQLFVQRHLFALVVGESLARGLSNGAQLVREGLQHIGRAGGLWMWQFDEHEQSAGTHDKVPTALALPSPLMRSPSKWPGNFLSSTPGERTWMLSMSGIWPRLSWPLLRGVRLLRAWRKLAISSLRNSPTGWA